MAGKILEIYIARTGGQPELQASVEVEAKRGVVGDRYYDGTGTFSEKLLDNRKSEITFIAAEEVDAFNTETGEFLGYGEPRRNVVTLGVDLASLIGREFTIGDARFLGIERCEPCAHLASTVNSKVLPHLVHTGLRAAILTSGSLEPGQQICPA